jgi:hypothetical protein
MYGLPTNFDASFFIGRTVQSVSYSVNTITVIFDKQIVLTIESSYEYESLQSPDTPKEVGTVPVFESRLMEIAGLTVVGANGEHNGTLSIEFSGNRFLRCFDDSKQFESYRIMVGPREIVV